MLRNTIHEVILNYQSRFKNKWYFVKHEDLSIDPMCEFEKLFSEIDLKFNSKVKKYIDKTTTAKSSSDIEKKSTPSSNVKRNSKENIKAWKKRLSDEEIQKIKAGTEKVWRKFYTENDW